MAKTEVRAGIYCRISDAAADDEDGINRQIEDCLDRAAELGWEVVGRYADPNTSAWKADVLRKEYKRMTDDLLAGNIDAIIVWDIDRLLRRPIELERLIEAVERKGGNRVADAQGEYDLTNGEHQDILRQKAIAANKESRDKSRRVKRAAQSRALRGEPAHKNATKVRPFGYDFDYVTVRKDEALLIKKAAKSLLAGTASLNGIATGWNAAGIKTARGKEWSYQAVKVVLTSPRIAGLQSSGSDVLLDRDGKPVEGNWDGILDVETWERLRKKLSDPTRRTNFEQGNGRRYLLTGGRSFCGKCGATLQARPREKGTYSDGDKRCYGCKSGKGCGLRHQASTLEDFIRDAVIEALDSPKVESLMRGSDKEQEREKVLFTELRKVDESLVKLDDDYYDDIITRARYLRQKQRLDERRTSLERELASIQTKGAVVDVPRGAAKIRKAWDSAGMEWRQAIVSALVEKVIVHPAPKRGQNGFDPKRVEVVWR